MYPDTTKVKPQINKIRLAYINDWTENLAKLLLFKNYILTYFEFLLIIYKRLDVKTFIPIESTLFAKE